MGVLLSGYPTAILIEDTEYPINADYQTAIQIILAFEDDSLVALEKYEILIELLYKKTPHNLKLAYEKGVKFLDCGEDTKEIPTTDCSRKYSFSHDERYIFAGVDRVLNGKLSKGEFVHWWEFVMAFMELPEDCTMSRIIYFRTQFQKGKLTKEERQAYHQNKNMFQLPEELSDDEESILNDFMVKLGEKG